MILAHLQEHRLKNIFLAHGHTNARERLDDDWQQFRDRMKSIRRQGFYARSEIDHDFIGVAAPVFRTLEYVTGCLRLVRERAVTTKSEISYLGTEAIRAEREISDGILPLAKGGAPMASGASRVLAGTENC